MGFRVDTRADLVLTDMDGAEVSVRIGVPISFLRDWDAAKDLEEQWAVFLAAALPEWNLEDADGPIPVADESLTRLPLPVVRAMLRGWREATVNPPAPLPQPSSSSTPSAGTSRRSSGGRVK